MRAVRLDLQEGSDAPPVRGHDAGLGELPGRVTAWSWDSQGDAVALGTADGIMALHRCSHPNRTKKVQASPAPAWPLAFARTIPLLDLIIITVVIQIIITVVIQIVITITTSIVILVLMAIITIIHPSVHSNWL